MSEPNQIKENRLTSERHKAFEQALEILYIKGNISGRLKFMEEWPDAAYSIFGPELIGFDTEGVQDRQRRAVLEDEAEGRRVQLLEIVSTVEEKSAKAGALITDYVRDVINGLGRETALLMYSPWVVDKFIQASPEKPARPVVKKAPSPIEAAPEPVFAVSAEEMKIAPIPEPRLEPAAEVEKRTAPHPDDASDIRPISVEPPPEAKELTPPPIPQESAPEPEKPAAAPRRKTLKIFGIKESPGGEKT